MPNTETFFARSSFCCCFPIFFRICSWRGRKCKKHIKDEWRQRESNKKKTELLVQWKRKRSKNNLCFNNQLQWNELKSGSVGVSGGVQWLKDDRINRKENRKRERWRESNSNKHTKNLKQRHEMDKEKKQREQPPYIASWRMIWFFLYPEIVNLFSVFTRSPQLLRIRGLFYLQYSHNAFG